MSVGVTKHVSSRNVFENNPVLTKNRFQLLADTNEHLSELDNCQFHKVLGTSTQYIPHSIATIPDVHEKNLCGRVKFTVFAGDTSVVNTVDSDNKVVIGSNLECTLAGTQDNKFQTVQEKC